METKKINLPLPKLNKKQILDFDVIYKRYYPIVLRYVKYKVRRDYIAEEITNDAFISFYKHLPEYDSSKSLVTTWLYNIVKNHVIDYYRSLATKKNTLFANSVSTSEQMKDESVRFLMLPDMGLPVDSLHDTIMASVNILKAMDELKGNKKTIAMRYFYDDHTYNQIASELNVPLNTIKVTILRIREKLKVSLAKEYKLICYN